MAGRCNLLGENLPTNGGHTRPGSCVRLQATSAPRSFYYPLRRMPPPENDIDYDGDIDVERKLDEWTEMVSHHELIRFQSPPLFWPGHALEVLVDLPRCVWDREWTLATGPTDYPSGRYFKADIVSGPQMPVCCHFQRKFL